jgi:hypothetical protein
MAHARLLCTLGAGYPLDDGFGVVGPLLLRPWHDDTTSLNLIYRNRTTARDLEGEEPMSVLARIDVKQIRTPGV